MAGQGSVGEAELADRSRLVDDVHDAARLEPPVPEGSRHYRHDLAGLDRRLGRLGFHPAQSKLLPPPQGGCRRLEYGLTSAQSKPGAIHHNPDGRCRGGRSHGRIAEFQRRLLRQEAATLGVESLQPTLFLLTQSR